MLLPGDAGSPKGVSAHSKGDAKGPQCAQHNAGHFSTHHGLEAGVELGQEWGLSRECQHTLLNHGALHVVVLDDHVLLQDLHGVEFIRALPLSQHHLSGADDSRCR